MALITMTLWGALLIAVVAMIRLTAINKLPKKVLLIIWALTLIRLLIPFSLPVCFIGMPETSSMIHAPLKIANITPVNSSLEPAGEMSSANTTEHGAALAFSSNPLSLPISFNTIWLTGAFLLAAYFLFTHFRWLQRYRMSLPVDDPAVNKWLAAHTLRRTVQVRRSDNVISPLTYGLLRPIILLPKAMDYADEDQLKYVLTHELVHIKRFDILLKWLLVAALCIHWFNPFVWIMFFLANRDIELSCDEAVVWEFGQSAKADYALTLIRMAESKSKFTALYSSFSKNSVEERVVAIMKIRKTNLLAVLIVLVLAAGTTMTFASSAEETRSLGLFAEIPGLDADKHAGHINIVEETDGEDRLSIQRTLFTDRHVYAVISMEDEVVGDVAVNGRIAYSDSDQTYYALAGELKELASENGRRQFIYSGTIAPPAAPPTTNPMLALAAGDDYFMKHNSLWWDHEGKALKLNATIDGTEHLLTAPVTNVYTDWIVVHPNSQHYAGEDYYDTIVLTPYTLKMTGTSTKTYDDLWFGSYVKITIVLADRTQINFSKDTRGLIYDEFYNTGSSHGYSDVTGEFYGFWTFRGWEVDLNEVTALIIDGLRYPVNKN